MSTPVWCVLAAFVGYVVGTIMGIDHTVRVFKKLSEGQKVQDGRQDHTSEEELEELT